MNEKLKELAEQAGVLFDTDPTYTYGASPKVLERFADLVRQDEREKCAKAMQPMLRDMISRSQAAEIIRGRTE
jgi:hypothetical protein